MTIAFDIRISTNIGLALLIISVNLYNYHINLTDDLRIMPMFAHDLRISKN